jgi:Cysteine-rich CPXCG
MEDTFPVSCPYCGEALELYVEPDVRGSYVQDCEVCCQPMLVRVVDDGSAGDDGDGGRDVTVESME